MENRNQIEDQYDDEIDLREVFSALWADKIKIVVVTVVFAVMSFFYAQSEPYQYKATTLLAPAQESSGGVSGAAMGQLGGLHPWRVLVSVVAAASGR